MFFDGYPYDTQNLPEMQEKVYISFMTAECSGGKIAENFGKGWKYAMIDTILFDLDGTLLPLNQDRFARAYLDAVADFFAQSGYNGRHVVRALWEGMTAMLQNDGSQTNADAFWAGYCHRMGPNGRQDALLFEEFYASEFAKVRRICGDGTQSAELISWLKAQNINLILATNPVFPRIATLQRIRWAGLEPQDFQWITTYENTSFCKPNPDYYREILKNCNLQPEQCIMVGNDTTEDLAAAKLGIPVFLLTDCLLDKAHVDVGEIPHGSFRELKEFLQERI